jgi:isocitrate/isopropylmalate dehydrogenase
MIGSVAMMLDRSLGMREEAGRIWHGMRQVFGQGYTTADLRDVEGELDVISTVEFGDRVAEACTG